MSIVECGEQWHEDQLEAGRLRKRIHELEQEVAESRHQGQALRQAEERLRLIFENAREYAIITLSLDRTVTSWNPGAAEMLGYAEDDILESCADVLFTEEDRRAGLAEREAALAQQQGWAEDDRWHVRKDGSRFWASGYLMPLRNAKHETLGYVKIIRDRTEAREAALALQQSREELAAALACAERARAQAESATEAKDQFLAILSHELRTPLTPVLMGAQILLRRTDLPEPVISITRMIKRNIEIEANLVDDLLDLTRIAHGKLDLNRVPMDAHAAIQCAVEITQPDLEKKRQELKLALLAPAHVFLGDLRRMRQVFWNLLENASKFTPEGGEIRIVSRNEPGKFVVEFTDTGKGIEAVALPKIFQPFDQGDAAVLHEFGGLGLGLAIAKATVDAHGGSLRAASEGLGKGATMTVELPLDPTSG